MDKNDIKAIMESLIFVSEEPISVDLIAMVLEETGITKNDVKELLQELKNDYTAATERGLHLVEVAGGFQLRSKPSVAEWIQKLNVPRSVKLSQPAMETLAIIAYRQPVMRSAIEEIRGVDSGGVIKTLMEKDLVRIIGKSDEPGQPLVYATSTTFLATFGLNSLKELPTLKEIDDLAIRDRVGSLGKAEVGEEVPDISEGVGAVVDEYRESIEAYKPDPEKLLEDELSIKSLEKSIKNLRALEKEIFPKEREEIQLVEKEFDETAVAQDNSEIDGTLPAEGGDGNFEG